ncbi:hypothetical protein AMS68_000257 [Peltaster fructicola]|uniref:NUDE domain-containing protein n=1 Tax=Peltaster fructicola TaxID=286661 RepID=A0A6H0XJP3_9PEZI|nr:hypothetical protein AMS68_000257 [Peltaster fructicola]
MTSSPLRPGATQEESLDWYKRQYEQLENDLADFQASSKELEEQLERDVDTAEKNERKLKEQVEKLGFEVDEWKGKHKQAKAEANTAHNALQKEITSIREQNRSLQLKLRDIEVANDDYERQARNTTTSLEDFESRLNVSIERGVLLEEEVRNGDAEREALRIENQRLRDELGDLKVESEITLEKLRLSGKTIENLRTRKPGNLAVRSLRALSPGSESGRTSSPTMSTPPPRSDASEVPTPPSPPLSDEAAAPESKAEKTPARRVSLIPDAAATPRPSAYGVRGTIRHSRGPSVASTTSNAPSGTMRPPVGRARPVASPNASARLPRSESLHQMKSLRIRMQKIEERVQSARSKLPSRDTTPKASPSAGQIPSSVTVRRSSNRQSSATESADQIVDTETPGRRESTSHIKRLSYGIPRPASRASNAHERPPSRVSTLERPPSAAASRPSSRLSMTGGTRPSSRASGYGDSSRPQSSLSGAYSHTSGTPRTHRPSASVSELRRRAAESEETPQAPRYGLGRRTTLDKNGTIAPSLTRRQSHGLPTRTVGRRTSVPAIHDGLMRPPPRTSRMSNVANDANGNDDTSELGETY